MSTQHSEKPNRTPDRTPLDRRSFVKSIAALGAGLATSAVLPRSSRAQDGAPADIGGAGTRANLRGPGRVVASDSATVVETTAGKIRGYRRGGVYVFKGVPYGASTSGAARFMPPAKAEPWPGIRNALSYGRTCPASDPSHVNTDGKNRADKDEDAFLLHRGCAEQVAGEDCLRVNLWTPEINGPARRPVMVYMHGGGFSGGCSQDLLSYEGENLARNHDVVVVNHNHRLNVYGYLNLAELGGDKYAASANVGMLDIVAVLEWIRDNISNFGGDPGNVMIFGQSGGGGKVAALMAMPRAKGLFHRAVIESGPYLRMSAPEDSGRLAAAVLAELNLTKLQVDELQNLPVGRLSGAAAAALRKLSKPPGSVLKRDFGGIAWEPTVDGILLPNHPFEPDSLAVSAGIPLITGTNFHEFVNGVDNPEVNSLTDDELVRRVQAAFGDKSGEIIDAYRREYPRATPFDLYASIAVAPVRQAAFTQAARKAAVGAAPAYSYVFGWRTPMLDGRPGAFHSCEVSFVTDNAELCDHYSGCTPEALALAKAASGAWVAFARTGNPNHSGLPSWPVFTSEDNETMFFDTPCEVRKNFEAEGRRLTSS
jgi:para-nitrobenzyl esterase